MVIVEWRLAGKTEMYSEKPCPSPTLSTTNLTSLDPVLKAGRRGGKPATNRLSYGAADGQLHLYYGTQNRC
jgi:hypothetical protein